MKKILLLITLLILSISPILADEGHDDEVVFGISPSNFTLENGQPGQIESLGAIVDNDIDTDLVFDFKLTRLNPDESEVEVDLSGDVVEFEVEGLVDGQFIAKASSETPINLTLTISGDIPDGTFVYYLDLVDVTEGGPFLDGNIFMTFEVGIKDSTLAEVDGSFSLDINPWVILGGCLVPIALVTVVIIMVRKKKEPTGGK